MISFLSSPGCRNVQGADGRPIGAAARNANRLAGRPRRIRRRCASTPRRSSPSVFPAPAGPAPAAIGGETEYGAARNTLADAYARENAVHLAFERLGSRCEGATSAGVHGEGPWRGGSSDGSGQDRRLRGSGVGGERIGVIRDQCDGSRESRPSSSMRTTRVG